MDPNRCFLSQMYTQFMIHIKWNRFFFSMIKISTFLNPLQEYDVAFMETSAKTGMNVDLAFMAVAR